MTDTQNEYNFFENTGLLVATPFVFPSRQKYTPFYERRVKVAPSFYFVMRGAIKNEQK